MCWLFRDEASPHADALYAAIQDGQKQVHVPAIFYLELLNAILVGQRRGRCQPDQVNQFLTTVLALPIVAEGSGDAAVLRRTCDLAREHSLSSYDAAYLEMAVRLQAPLATLGRRLQSAAGQAGITCEV
jgi:predicted nucleic acid-binding protein